MKKLTKISLAQLYKNDMAAREMNMLRGGNNCGCGCLQQGTNFKSNIYESNWEYNIIENESDVCSWEGSGEVTVYGGNIVPDGL